MKSNNRIILALDYVPVKFRPYTTDPPPTAPNPQMYTCDGE